VGFKDNKIAYAAFVEPSAVVDHQHVAGSSPLQRLKENVDAASVSSRDYTPREAASWNNCVQERGAAAHWGLSADARIRQMGGSQCCKPLPNLFVIHASYFTPIRPIADLHKAHNGCTIAALPAESDQRHQMSGPNIPRDVSDSLLKACLTAYSGQSVTPRHSVTQTCQSAEYVGHVLTPPDASWQGRSISA
jgi:hypothetical protein